MSREWLRVDFQHYCGTGSPRSAGPVWASGWSTGRTRLFHYPTRGVKPTQLCAVPCALTGKLGFLLSARCRCVVSVLAEIVQVLCVCKYKRNLRWQLQDIPCSSWLQRELWSVCVWEFFKSLMFIKYSNRFLWNSMMTKSNIKRLSHYFSFCYVLFLFTNFFFIFPVSLTLLYHRLLHGLSHKIISLWKKHPSIYRVYFLWWLLLWIYLTIVYFFPFTTF